MVIAHLTWSLQLITLLGTEVHGSLWGKWLFNTQSYNTKLKSKWIREQFLSHYAIAITVEEGVTEPQVSLKKVQSMPDKPCQEAK